MPELASEFNDLPAEHQNVLSLAQERHNIEVKPLQKITGGLSGAFIYLVSVASSDTSQVEHLVLKLDHPEDGESDEIERHAHALTQSPPHFARHHMADLAFERVVLEQSIAIFYRIAGESLHQYKPISQHDSQSQLAAIFGASGNALLEDWNADMTVEQAVHPQSLLPRWLGYRLDAGEKIERFMQETCQIDPNTGGLIVNGNVYPNPLLYARQADRWGAVRPIDTIVGFQHGDLNTNNILVKMSGDGGQVQDYYVIDFANFDEHMPLLFDHLYLELAYLLNHASHVAFPKWVDFVTRFAQQDMLDGQDVAIEMAGAAAVVGAARATFDKWVQDIYPSLSDDLWGQFWMAAVAAGLNFCNKSAASSEIRLAGLIYAAAHLKRYAGMFDMPMPSQAADIYHAGQTDASPATDSVTASSSALPFQLPADRTPFVGRTSELADIAQLLVDPGCRLLTLHGPGGIGKTRLALQVAGQHVESFPQGACFVALAPLISPDAIVQAIARELAFTSAQENEEEALLNFLRNKRLLLITDNFEHVVAGAGLLSRILQAGPGVTILATSREVLNLQEETVFRLQGMELDDWKTIEDALEHSAVNLFMQSARRADPDFAFQAEDLPHLIRILRMVQGLPLGILLAAAWVDMLSLEEIAHEISNSLDFLQTDLQNVPERQRSIQAVFDYSWTRLTDSEQSLFKMLSVFEGGFTRGQAQQVANASLPELAGLVNKSLLHRDSVSKRFEVHGLLRQYAGDQLQSVPEANTLAHTAHATFFADFMQRGWEPLTGDGQKVTLGEIERDIDNLRTAWRYWIAEANVGQLSKFLDSFWFVHNIRGWYHAGVELFGDAIIALRALPSSTASEEVETVVARMLALQGWFTNLVSNPEKGLKLVDESIAMLRRLNRREELVIPLLALASNSAYRGKLVQTKQAAQEALEIATERDHQWAVTISLAFLGLAAIRQQDYEEAQKLGEESLKIAEANGNYWGIWFSSGPLLGWVAVELADFPQARERYRRSLHAAGEIDFREGTAMVSRNLGQVAFELDEIEEAQQYFVKRLKIAAEINQTREVVDSLYDIARVWSARGKQKGAVELLTLVLQHPASEHTSRIRGKLLREEAEQLMAQLQANLPADAIMAAQERGAALTLDVVVPEVLAEETVITVP